jgi:hypothetical protein
MVFASSKCSYPHAKKNHIKNMGLPVLFVKMLSFWNNGAVVDCLYVADNKRVLLPGAI